MFGSFSAWRRCDAQTMICCATFCESPLGLLVIIAPVMTAGLRTVANRQSNWAVITRIVCYNRRPDTQTVVCRAGFWRVEFDAAQKRLRASGGLGSTHGRRIAAGAWRSDGWLLAAGTRLATRRCVGAGRRLNRGRRGCRCGQPGGPQTGSPGLRAGGIVTVPSGLKRSARARRRARTRAAPSDACRAASRRRAAEHSRARPA